MPRRVWINAGFVFSSDSSEKLSGIRNVISYEKELGPNQNPQSERNTQHREMDPVLGTKVGLCVQVRSLASASATKEPTKLQNHHFSRASLATQVLLHFGPSVFCFVSQNCSCLFLISFLCFFRNK